jgi:hypothetical protein
MKELNEKNSTAGSDETIDLKPAANRIVGTLLGDRPLASAPLLEASVHTAKRTKIWVASFTGPNGGQIWKSTGLTDYDQALALAKHWEAQAREQRAKLGRIPRKAGTRVARSRLGAGPSGLTQAEVGQILGLSERAVRQIEVRAFRKLRAHPWLRELWREYSAGELDEQHWVLDPTEIAGAVRRRRHHGRAPLSRESPPDGSAMAPAIGRAVVKL